MGRGGQSYRVRQATFTELDAVRLDRVSMPVDVTDADEFPEIAKALEWAAKLSPERRKEFGA